MKYTTLGRTNLKVSKAGLGCGGHSRIGIEKGEDVALGIINTAYELGINFYDTSSVYGTEEVLGKGLSGKKRDSFVISSKFSPFDFTENPTIKDEGSLTAILEESLRKLNTDYIDIFNLHAVRPEFYNDVLERFMPELINAKQSGKIRFIGVTEMFVRDCSHEMLKTALNDDLFDVIMTGLNILNFSAKEFVLLKTMKKNVGTLLMFAVRNTLSNEEHLKETLYKLNERRQIDISGFDMNNPLGFLTKSGVASSVIEAAYRFCANTEGIDVVLTGTSNPKHLQSNVQSILMEALPDKTLKIIGELFGRVDSVSGE